MDMVDQDSYIYLEASCPERNVARRYAIAISRDLFGAMIVDFSWGRIGRAGQGRAVSFASLEEANAFARKLIARRKGALGRIGTSYAVVDSHSWQATH